MPNVPHKIRALGLVSQRNSQRSVGKAGTTSSTLTGALVTKPLTYCDEFTANGPVSQGLGPFSIGRPEERKPMRFRRVHRLSFLPLSFFRFCLEFRQHGAAAYLNV